MAAFWATTRRLFWDGLQRIGLEPRGRSAELSARIVELQLRLAETKALHAAARARTQAYRERAHHAKEVIARKRQTYEDNYGKRVEKLERQYERVVTRLTEREAKRFAKLNELRESVTQADRSVRVGRERLQSVELKLDLIEGAVNILDRRFRTSAFETDKSDGY